MRRRLFLLLCITLAAVISPVFAEGDEVRAEAREKGVQTDREFQSRGGVVESISGMVSIATPKWNRVFSTADADPECGMTSLVSGFGEMPYVLTRLEVTGSVDVDLELAVIGTGTDIEDTTLAVYCAPFTPGFPQHNLLAYDDDDGDGALSAFSASDGVTLKPGEIYVVVLSPFNLQNPDDWNYQIDLFSPDVSTITVPVELQRFSVE
jgi:hypothetical protein